MPCAGLGRFRQPGEGSGGAITDRKWMINSSSPYELQSMLIFDKQHHVSIGYRSRAPSETKSQPFQTPQ